MYQRIYEEQNMKIFTTPCNGIRECADGSDESGCQNNPTTTLVLTISMLTVFLVFLVLRYFRSYFISEVICSKITSMTTDELIIKLENNLLV